MLLADRPSDASRPGQASSANRSATWVLAVVVEARHQRVDVGVGLDLGRVDVELPAPDQARLLTEIDDLLEEALEDVDAQPLPDAGQAGVVGQRLVQGVAEVPAVGQVEAGRLDELALGADALEEHDQLELEEDDRVDAGPAPFGIPLARSSRGQTTGRAWLPGAGRSCSAGTSSSSETAIGSSRRRGFAGPSMAGSGRKHPGRETLEAGGGRPLLRLKSAEPMPPGGACQGWPGARPARCCRRSGCSAARPARPRRSSGWRPPSAAARACDNCGR